MPNERIPDIIVRVGDVEIGMARPRLREAMFLDWLSSKLPAVTGIPWLYQYGWCKAMSRTVYIKNLDYVLPTMASNEDQCRMLYQAFLDLPNEVTEKWGEGVRALELPGTPVHQRPISEVPEELKTDPNSLSGAPNIQTTSSPLLTDSTPDQK